MPFLTINEQTIPISTKKGDESWQPLGDRSRVLDGSLRETNEGTKRNWSFSTTPQVQADAEAIKRLFNSTFNGFHVSYDRVGDFFSDGKGLPGAVTGAPTTSATLPKFGARRLALTAADRLIYAAELLPTVTSKYTVMWHLDPGPGFIHRARTFDGSTTVLYEDGVIVGGPFPEVTVNGSGSVVVGDLAGVFSIDDLVILKFRAPSAWLAGSWGVVTQAWSDPPALFANGDMMDSEQTIVKPSVSKVTWKPFKDQAGAVWDKGGQVVEFTLAEV